MQKKDGSGIDIEQAQRHVLNSVKQAAVMRDPFAHFRLENIFPPSVYQTLINNFPNPEHYHEMRHKDSLRADGTSTRFMLEFHDDEFAKLCPEQAAIWSSVRDILCLPELRDLILEKFKPEIDARVLAKSKHLKLSTDDENRPIAYPRPGLFRDTAGYQITPHPDTPLKIVTMQFYLPRDDSQESLGTSLYRPTSRIRRALNPWCDKYVPVKRFPFLPNTGYAFAVTQNSWHGRETIAEAFGDRYSILTFYLRDDVRLKY